MDQDNKNLSTEDKRGRKFAAILCLVAGILITAAKYIAYQMTASQGVYSDALESIVNVVTAAFGLFVVYYGMKGPDEDHPYGHGKVEYFSAAFEGGLIAFAAVIILVEAAQAYIGGHKLNNLDTGTFIIAGAGVANLLLGIFLLWAGKKYRSAALKGSGAHVISDFWTSAAVIVGLIAVKFTGWVELDILVAVLGGIYLAITGFKLVKKSIGELMDAEDLNLLSELANIFEANTKYGIIQVHHTKIIRSGWFHHIDAHIVVPEFWTVDEAHRAVDSLENAVIKAYSHSGEMNFHLDPCGRRYCNACDVQDCKIRREAFQKRLPISVAQLRSSVEPSEYRRK